MCAVVHPDPSPEDRDRAQEWFERAAARENNRAVDLLALAARGRTLEAAARYVLVTPYEQRYIERMAARVETEATGGSRQPRPLRLAKPIYPLSLRMDNTTGEALVRFVVDVTGRVRDAEVVSATHPLFGERAVETVRLWRFQPGQKDGRLVNSRLQVPVYFRLQQDGLPTVDDFFAYVHGRAVGAEPTELGPALLALARQHRFHPVMLGDTAVEGSVVLPFARPASPPGN
jgi:TonB family protein